MHKKINSFFALLFILVIVLIISVFIIGKNKTINNYLQNANTINYLEDTSKTNTENTTLFFVGDIMLTRGVKSSVVKNFNGDYSKLFENLPELKNADILFGNLEGPVSDKGNNVGSIYSFEMDPIIIPALKNASFDIVSFANNHVGDWNINAFKDTLQRIEEGGILKTGAGLNKEEAETPTIIEKNKVKFGFLAFSDVGPDWIEAKDNTAGILLASDPNLENIIKNAKLKCDVLIVSFHFGEEYKLIHNKRQEYLAHTVIDNGADMVIGSHPHVMEDTEEYKGKPIIYSLGNFIFDQYFSKNTMRGMLVEATFENKNLIKTEQKIITLDKKFQPEGIFTKEEIAQKDKLSSSACPKPKKDYEDMALLNIGQNISIPDVTYIPKDLEELELKDSTRKGICVVKEVKDSLESMIKDALEEGFNIKVSSGFRSYEYQKGLIATAIKEKKSDIDISIAKAGYSEHQLGTTVDLTSSSINYDSASGNFYKTPESDWLKKNAYLYGFIQSYPLGSEDITGYKSEPWHYRYVGIENAKKIKDGKLTITEFLK